MSNLKYSWSILIQYDNMIYSVKISYQGPACPAIIAIAGFVSLQLVAVTNEVIISPFANSDYDALWVI